jgi:hypothetical protein
VVQSEFGAHQLPNYRTEAATELQKDVAQLDVTADFEHSAKIKRGLISQYNNAKCRQREKMCIHR